MEVLEFIIGVCGCVCLVIATIMCLIVVYYMIKELFEDE